MTNLSSAPNVQVLLIEDNTADAVLLRELLYEQGLERSTIHHVVRLADAKAYLSSHIINVVLLDLSLPDGYGLQSVRAIRAAAPDLPIIVLTGQSDEALAIQTLQEGVQDYLLKQGVDGRLLERAIRYAIERKQAELIRVQLLREQAARNEAEIAQQRMQLLVAASAILASSLDYTVTLTQVVRLIVPALAEYCMIDIVEQDGRPRQVAVASTDPDREQLVRRSLAHVLLALVRSHTTLLTIGKPIHFGDVIDVDMPSGCQAVEQLQSLRQLGFRSGMVVPLLARGQIVGILSVGSGETKYYGEREQAWIMELAQHVALAIDNALLYAAERQARNEAEAAVQTRDALFTIVSHDLKNPLTAIHGNAGLLRQRIVRQALPNNERLLNCVDRIEAASIRMLNQINELTDNARLQVGRPLDLHIQETDLVALVTRMVKEYQATTLHHQIVVQLESPNLEGWWDTERLERVIGNLLANAIKYSPQGGTITIAITQEVDAATRCACLVVQDQGLGIPASDLPLIFKPFYRAQNIANSFPGTGVGLASVQQIVLQHGGTITVASDEGHGTTFTVRLPIAAQPAHDLRDTFEEQLFIGI